MKELSVSRLHGRKAGNQAADPFLDKAILARLRRNLVGWFHRHGRDLPWRRSRDAYRIWVSEIMLQQTTVTAVIPYFERFLARFPTVEDLARAREHDVLRRWEGLGYYSRARNLRLAARQVVAEFAGKIPHDPAELVRLPGIGRYTAGAIASLAYDRPAPIVEANTLRVYARLLAFEGDVHATEGRNVIWSFAEEAVPRRSAGVFNQALMDLGAIVCTPVDPRCGECPVRISCRAFLRGVVREIPRPRVRPQTTFVNEAMIAVRREGRYLLRKGMPGERWAGLWGFLRTRLDNAARERNGGRSARRGPGVQPLSTSIRRQIKRAVDELCGLAVDPESQAFVFHHTVTRFRITLVCTIAEFQGGELPRGGNFRWVRPDQFGTLALSMPARKFADRIGRMKDEG